MVVCSALFNLVTRRQPAARLPASQHIQHAALAGARWRPVAHDAARLPAVVCDAATAPALAADRLFRGDGERFAGAGARIQRARSSTDRHDSGQPHPSVHAGIAGTRRLRWGKKHKGAKVHAAVDTLGNLLALHVTPANEQDRAQVEQLAKGVQDITGHTVENAYADQGYTGEDAVQQAQAHGIKLEVIKHTEARRGFVLLPRRWVVERSFAWAVRFRRLARDYERLAQTLAGFR
jgi:transposase